MSISEDFCLTVLDEGAPLEVLGTQLSLDDPTEKENDLPKQHAASCCCSWRETAHVDAMWRSEYKSGTSSHMEEMLRDFENRLAVYELYLVTV